MVAGIAFAGTLPAAAGAGIPDSTSTTVAWTASPIVVCPGGDGTRLEITLRDSGGNLIPDHLLELNFALTSCTPVGTCPTSRTIEASTDSNGYLEIQPYLGEATCCDALMEVSSPSAAVTLFTSTDEWKSFDLDGDCFVGPADSTIFAAAFMTTTCASNFNSPGGGVVDLVDYALFASHYSHGVEEQSLSVPTPSGSPVSVGLPPVTVTYSQVLADGTTDLTISGIGPADSSGYRLAPAWLPRYYDLSTTATFTGTIEVCLEYDETWTPDESVLDLMHYDSGNWTPVTTSTDTTANVICGEVTSFSPFALATSAGGPTGVLGETASAAPLFATTVQPNPFAASTTVRFALPFRAATSVRVYDVQGRVVAHLADGERAAGWHAVDWSGTGDDGRPVPAGVYFVRLEAGPAQETKRVVILR